MWWCRAALARACSSAAASASLSPSRSYIPIPVIETPPHGHAYDIFSRLFQERIILINGPISDDIASVVVAQLLCLDFNDPSKPLDLYINCSGGFATPTLAIYDTIQYIRSPVTTLCIGQAASMGSLLLAAGAPGKRRALPNARVMIGPTSGKISGQLPDVTLLTNELLKVRECFNGIYAKHTCQRIQRIDQFMEREIFMSPDEAKEYGIIDEVIENRSQ